MRSGTLSGHKSTAGRAVIQTCHRQEHGAGRARRRAGGVHPMCRARGGRVRRREGHEDGVDVDARSPFSKTARWIAPKLRRCVQLGLSSDAPMSAKAAGSWNAVSEYGRGDPD